MMRARKSRGAFTVLELVLVVTLVALFAVKVSVVFTQLSRTTARESSDTVLEDQARIVLDRIAYALMGADREMLDPASPTPLDSTAIGYQLSLGLENGQIVWSDPEEIGLDPTGTQVVWRRNPGAMDEQLSVWTSRVRPFLEGELANGVDDNGNGLVDERGVSFTVLNNRVTVRLTLGLVGEDGEVRNRTVETTVTCRNRS
jgi:hypothetical protein